MEDQKVNGQLRSKPRREFTIKDWRKWVKHAETHPVAVTAEHFGIVNSMIYGARARLGASRQASRRAAYKARRASKARGRRGSKGRKTGAYRGLYKALGPARALPATDALIYLEKARSKALRALAAGLPADRTGPILGLIELAIESLRGED